MKTYLDTDFVESYTHTHSDGATIHRRTFQKNTELDFHSNLVHHHTTIKKSYSSTLHGDPSSTASKSIQHSFFSKLNQGSQREQGNTYGVSQSHSSLTMQTYKATFQQNRTGSSSTRQTNYTITRNSGYTKTAIDRDPTINSQETTDTYSTNEIGSQTLGQYTYEFYPASIRFRTIWAKTSMTASYKSTIPVYDGQEYKTTTASLQGKHFVSILTTTEGTQLSHSDGASMDITNNAEMGKSYKTIMEAEMDERIGHYEPVGRNAEPIKTFTLLSKIVLGKKPDGNSVPFHAGLFSTQRSYDYENPENNGSTGSYTTNTFSQFLYNGNKITFFNPTKETTETRWGTGVSTRSFSIQDHTLKQTYPLQGGSVKTFKATTLSTISFNVSTDKISLLHTLCETTMGVVSASYLSASSSETEDAGWGDYERTRTTNSTSQKENSTSAFSYNRPNSLAYTSFGKADTARPAVQSGFGTSGTMYANFTGMFLPVMGVNLATNSFDGVANRTFAGYAPALFGSSMILGIHTHIYTQGQWVLTDPMNWGYEFQESTKTSQRKITDTNLVYASTLDLESVKNAYRMDLYTYSYGSTDEDLDEKWRQKFNKITAVTLGTSGDNYFLESADYAYEETDLSFESTEYNFVSTIDPQLAFGNDIYKDSNRKALNWINNSVYLKSNVYLVGGIGVEGSPKTAYLHQYTKSDTAYKVSLSTQFKESITSVTIPLTGVTTAGTAVSTLIDCDWEKAVQGSSVELPAYPYTMSLYYKDPETYWTDSNIELHPWDIPIGGSYGAGIVTKKGEAPQTYVSTLNPDQDASLHRTAVAYSTFANPETLAEAEYLKTFYSTQNEVPWIG